MGDLRFCPDGGWLVMGVRTVPDDPSDHYDPQSGAIVACNRLRCGSCGEVVRSAAAVDVNRRLKPSELDRQYDTADWTTLPWIESSYAMRLYACRCSLFACHSDAPTLDPNFDPESDREPPNWTCSGHIEPLLPLDVDGFRVAEQADLAPLAERVLGGWCPRTGPPPANFFPGVWAARVYCRLKTLPEAEAWALSIAEGLGSSEAPVRGLALHFFALNPDAPGFERVLEAAEQGSLDDLGTIDRTWFGRTEDDPIQDDEEEFGVGFGQNAWLLRPLLNRVFRSSLPLDDVDVRARDLVRGAVLEDSDVLDAEALRDLAAADGEWVARNARAIVRGKNHEVWQFMDALRRARREENLIIGGMAVMKTGSRKKRELAEWLDGMPDDSPYTFVLKQALAR
jgi:hypothetical protein